MPELPEVETVKRGLEKILGEDPVIKRVKILNPKLRFPVPKSLQNLIICREFGLEYDLEPE